MTFDQWVISRLRVHGAYAGVTDGAPGREMVAGLKRFQTASDLPATGLANEATVTLLRHEPKKPGSPLTIYSANAVPLPREPVWMREAQRYMGLKEIAGSKSNSTIMGWAKRLGGWVASFYTNDDIPWCGLAIANWISVTLPSEPLPANPLGALNWSKFGRQLAQPVLGAILTFKRPGGGHVGLYVGEDRTHYHVLGGNQANSVNITRIEKIRCEAIRWPTTGGEPVGGPVRLTAAGVPVSKNEA